MKSTNTIDIEIYFPKGYIANPYWPELEKLINIQKESGMKRARSAANARAALEQHLKSLDMTLAAYEDLERLAKRPFYTDSDSNIVIPGHHFYGMLVASADTIRAAGRACPPEQVRVRLDASDLSTGKTEPDGVWSRFVTVTSGTGAKLSNQRALREDFYIEDFTAKGSIGFSPEFVRPDTLRTMLEYGGQNIGIGASRKMGWGRFEVVRFEAKRAAA